MPLKKIPRAVFLHENIGHTKEVIIAAEQQLTKDKLKFENFNYDITKLTTLVHTYIRQIMSAGINQPTFHINFLRT
jgi:hypothetical protein